MNVAEFDHRHDMFEVNAWCEAWGLSPFPTGWLPRGFIVHGVAAMFVYRTDASVAFIENVISNPDAGDIARDEALDELVRRCEWYAHRIGARYLVGQSSHAAVVERGERHGFRASPRPLRQIVKVLGGSNE